MLFFVFALVSAGAPASQPVDKTITDKAVAKTVTAKTTPEKPAAEKLAANKAPAKAAQAASQPTGDAAKSAKAKAAADDSDSDDAKATEADDASKSPEGDEPVNDEAAELDALKELDSQTNHPPEVQAQTPVFPEDDLDLAKRAAPLPRRAHPEEVAVEIANDPGALFGRTLSIGNFDNWPLFVEFNGEGALYDPKAYDIPMTMNPMVEQWIKFFTGRGRDYFERWLSRSTRYIPAFREILTEEGMPKDTVYLSMIESGFNTEAYSRAKAAGPWQFMAPTGKRFGLHIDSWVDERRDFIKATHAAAKYLKELYEQFGDWYLAWAGYNAGGGKVNKAIAKYDTTNFFEMTNSKKRYLRTETKNYVPKLIAAAIIAKSPKRFGFTDVGWEQPFDFELATVNGPLDLKLAAEACGCDVDLLRDMNPALKHDVVPPGKSYELRIPRGTHDAFMAKLPEVSKAQGQYKTHPGRRGESLAVLAARYGSTIDLIREQNRLGDISRLKHTEDLVIPVVPGKKPQVIADPEPPQPRVAQRPKSEASVAASELPPADGYVEVASGDSLWSISQKFGVTVQDLKRWNNITNHHALQIGQRIRVKD